MIRLIACIVEEYRPGYPRFTALISAHEPWFICRRFHRLHARLLLAKQDRLSLLEKQIDLIDDGEKRSLFLSKSRCDKNGERQKIISEIDLALADYAFISLDELKPSEDDYVERTTRILRHDVAKPKDIKSLRNWLAGTAAMAREETAFIDDDHERELISLAPTMDIALQDFDDWVGHQVIRFSSGKGQKRLAFVSFPLPSLHVLEKTWVSYQTKTDFYFDHKRFCQDVSIDPHVHIWSGAGPGWPIRLVARGLLLLLISLLLLGPVVICNMIASLSIRIVVVLLATTSFVLVVTVLTRPKTMELIVAGATYTTVLIVFASGTSGLQKP
ncbi:hypothetical protein PG993_014904 [Apiospora rasikravindrae]|uniref:DUF6594 domain-containing protein n=1 Tax=Apiospora rasikravindrae TaxID=990691 RepID=A0ABR1RQJ3_9PEZI